MSAEDKPLVLLAVCGFERAKTRLRHVLGNTQTGALAQRLFEIALDSVADCQDIAEALVISDARDVLMRAEERGVRTAQDAPEVEGHAAQLRHFAIERRPERPVAMLMADLPLMRADALRAALVAIRDHEMVLAPDRHDQGVNFVAWARYEDALMHFGHADSFMRHLEAARSHHLTAAVLRRKELAWDLDEAGDVAALLNERGSELDDELAALLVR